MKCGLTLVLVLLLLCVGVNSYNFVNVAMNHRLFGARKYGRGMGLHTAIPIEADDPASIMHQELSHSSTSALQGSVSGLGMRWRWWAPVLVLVLQNSGLILTMRYSRVHAVGRSYLPCTAVLCAEVAKLVIALAASLKADADWSPSRLASIVKEDVLDKPRAMVLLAIPAVLYTVQNNLQYVATSHLSAPLFQVLYQMKLFASALFSVVLLRRKLSAAQWMSMLVLAGGVASVQFSQVSGVGAAAATAAASSSVVACDAVGVAAVACACITSGLAGALMERLLKSATRSIWMRSVQFGVLGTSLSALNCYRSTAAIQNIGGFFSGYSPVVWIVIALQAVGGLAIALVVKNADNIVKGFATSLSLLLSVYASHLLFADVVISPLLFFGSAAVVGSTLAFSRFGPKNKK